IRSPYGAPKYSAGTGSSSAASSPVSPSIKRPNECSSSIPIAAHSSTSSCDTFGYEQNCVFSSTIEGCITNAPCEAGPLSGSTILSNFERRSFGRAFTGRYRPFAFIDSSSSHCKVVSYCTILTTTLLGFHLYTSCQNIAIVQLGTCPRFILYSHTQPFRCAHRRTISTS